MPFSSVALFSWLRQPSTVTGLSAVAAAVTGVASGQMTTSSAVPVLVFGLVAMVLPDNSAAPQHARALADDVAVLARTGANPSSVAPLLRDAAALASDLRSASPPPSG